ncbi:MAG: tetratricopeptide repeat protein [Bradyrhizobiaceae bacterium]|nr:tetratricopeptide repeat protein [Bradyrhizobiaceae bacterium]
MSTVRTDIERAGLLLSTARSVQSDNAHHAIATLDEAIQLADHHVRNVTRDKTWWKEFLCTVLYERALLHEAQGDHHAMFADTEAAFTLISEVQDQAMAFKVRLLYGRSLLSQGAMDECLEIFTTLWSSVPTNVDQSVRGVIAGNIATVLFALKNFDEARTWFEHAAQVFDDYGIPSKQAHALRGIGMSYSKMGEYSEAFSWYNRALELVTKSNKYPAREHISVLESIGVDHLNLADITQKQAHYKTALKHFHEALGLAQQYGYVDQEIAIQRNIGLVYAESAFNGADKQRAREQLELSLQKAQEHNIKLLESQAFRDLSVILEDMGDIPAALAAVRSWHQLERELYNERSAKQVRQLELRLATERANSERTRAEQQAELLSQIVEQQREQVTSITMAIGQKNATLRDVRIRLLAIAEAGSDPAMQKEIRMLARKLELAEDSDEYWKGLESQLTLVHSAAIQALHSRHPTLTPTEQRVCALVFHGLSTKDVARILGTEARSVEKYRQRIRKKLELTLDVNIKDYMTSLVTTQSVNTPESNPR